MNEFTFSDFQELTENEKSLSKLLLLENNKKEKQDMPSEKTINNILAYSKALSVRKSDDFGYIENILN